MSKLYNNPFKALLMMLLFIGSGKIASASHTPGGNITYECVGPNQYLVTMTLFEDCGTAFESSANQTLTVTNTCGLTNPTASLPNIVYQQEVSQLCPPSLGTSECNGGTLPGVWLHQWQGIITLPGCCNHWTFAYSSCCQNTTNNLTGQPGYYWESTLDNCAKPCNFGVHITNPTVPYVCVNQPVCYNLGAIETDGDSLSFELVSSQSSATATVTYQAGFSGAVPIPGITIDPLTGQIDFLPTVTGNYVVVILVKEWDSNGNLIGTLMHQLQFEVVNCNNQVINCSSSGAIDSLTGNVIQTGPTTIEMCETDTASFQIGFKDPDAGDSLSLVSNILSVLPGATWNVVYPNAGIGEYDTVVAYISWTPPVGSANTTNAFIVTIQDYACPVSGVQTIVYYINVLGITQAYADTIICNDQWANLHVEADFASSYTWTAISGDPINVGVNFTCDTCAVTQASPSVTTMYEISTNGVCAQYTTDTVTVEVVPDYQYNVELGDSIMCFGDSTDISVSVTPQVSGYTFAWSQPTAVTGDSILHPVTTGANDLIYTVTSPQGCVEQDTIPFHYYPQIAVIPGSITPISCPGVANGAVQLQGYGVPGYIFSISGPVSGTNTTGLFTNLPSGNYTIQLTDTLGCIGNGTFTVGVGPGITLNTLPAAETCLGANDGALVASSNGTTPLTFDLTGPLNQSNSTGAFTGLPAGSYNLTVTDANGCTSTTSLTIGPGVTQNGSAAPTPTTCSYTSDGSVILTAIPNSGSSYTFTIDGQGISTSNTSGNFTGLPAGGYQYTIVDNNGCSYTDSFYVTSPPPVVADFLALPTMGLEPLTVFFTNTSSNAVNYFWFFGDGNTSITGDPSNTYTSGTYTATLIAQNGNCFDTTTTTIVVVYESILIIPNVITPNGDGTNDVFKVTHDGITSFNCTIFNRWGTELYKYSDVNGHWDGTFDGKPVEEGTYFYMINAMGLEGREYSEKGTINVFQD